MRRLVAILGVFALALTPRAAGAGAFTDMRGSVGLGYTKLFLSEPDSLRSGASGAPAGSFSVAAGLDFPCVGDFRWGGEIAFHMLGSRNVTSGSLAANVDYSAFETALLLHYAPRGLGPIGRISAGPALVSARAELSTSGGGAAFRGYAVEEVAPAVALGVTLHSARPRPVQVGLELCGRWAFLDEADDWLLTSARLAFLF